MVGGSRKRAADADGRERRKRIHPHTHASLEDSSSSFSSEPLPIVRLLTPLRGTNAEGRSSKAAAASQRATPVPRPSNARARSTPERWQRWPSSNARGEHGQRPSPAREQTIAAAAATGALKTRALSQHALQAGRSTAMVERGDGRWEPEESYRYRRQAGDRGGRGYIPTLVPR